MIAAFAIQAKQSFIYIRAEFFEGARILERAIKKLKKRTYVETIFLAHHSPATWWYIVGRVHIFVVRKQV